MTLRASAMRAGARRISPAPSHPIPSCPSSFAPHASMLPSARRKMVWSSPQAIFWTRTEVGRARDEVGGGEGEEREREEGEGERRRQGEDEREEEGDDRERVVGVEKEGKQTLRGFKIFSSRLSTPSCPLLLSPKAQTSPPPITTNVCAYPHATSDTSPDLPVHLLRGEDPSHLPCWC
eukprot:709194-Hanusia_phi.AAC.1